MGAPTPNAALAYQVMDQIDAHPQQWVQGMWVGEADCGTVACFAGWAVLLSGCKLSKDGTDIVLDGPPEVLGKDVPTAADVLLGISTDFLNDRDLGDPYDGLLGREALGERVAEIFGPRPEQSYGTGCRCDYLGSGTPEHAPSPLCRSLRPDADREMQPPPCADHEASELNCPVCTAQRRAFYAALGRDDPNDDPRPYDGEPDRIEPAQIVDHGPVKPPYGTPERAQWDSDHESDWRNRWDDVPPNAGSIA